MEKILNLKQLSAKVINELKRLNYSSCIPENL